MTISETQFHGNARITTASTLLVANVDRVLTCWNSVSINVTLPARGDCRYGSRIFYVVVGSGSANVVLKNSSGTTLRTLTSGTVCVVSNGINDWVTRTHALSAAHSVTTDARGSAIVTLTPQTFAECSNGTGCDQADDYGNVPLDGQDGRDLVVARFIEDMNAAANYNREPIRAADLIMPSVVLLGPYRRDDFEVDPNHPYADVQLNDNFWNALENGGERHALVYSGTTNSTVSRHWMHSRYGGTLSPDTVEWYHSGALAIDFEVDRSVWEKTIEWQADDGEMRELTLRFVMETKMDGDAIHEQECLLGSGFTVSLFTNALDPTFEDGDSFTPFGTSGSVVFTYADPVVSGGANGVGVGDINDKWYHPHLLAHGALVMSLHSPINREWLEPGQRETIRPFQDGYTYPGWNMTHYASMGAFGGWKRWRSDVPWVDSSGCEGRYPLVAFRNVTFGRNGPTNLYSAGYTRGGGFPKSKPMEFVCWENGGAHGRTYFIPTRPGWTEDACGELDVAGGSSGGIVLCVDDNYGIDYDGDGVREWPVTVEVSPCSGHPDEPAGSIGGSHTCFHTSDASDFCCIDLTTNQVAGAYDKCKAEEMRTYRDDGGTCQIKTYSCALSAGSWMQYVVYLYDYSYGWHQPSEPARSLTYQRVLPDPTYVSQSFSLADSSLSLLTTIAGSWTKTTSLVQATSNNSVLEYTNAGAALRDSKQTGTINGSITVKHGGFSRRTDANNGYFWTITVSGGNTTARLFKRVAGVETTFATSTYATPTTAYDFEFLTHGDTLTLTLKAPTGDVVVTDFDDAFYTAGYSGCTGDNGAVINDYACVDLATVFMNIEVAYGDIGIVGCTDTRSMTLNFPRELQGLYLQCNDDGSDTADCWSFASCDCAAKMATQQYQTLMSYCSNLSHASSNAFRDPEAPCPECGSRDCDCDGCVATGLSLYVNLGLSCRDVTIDGNDPTVCGGYKQYFCPIVSCE